MKVYVRESLHFEWEENHKCFSNYFWRWLPKFIRKVEKQKTYIVHLEIDENVDEKFLYMKVSPKYLRLKKDPFKHSRTIDSIEFLGGDDIEIDTWGDHFTVKIQSEDEIEPWLEKFKASNDYKVRKIHEYMEFL